MERLKALDKRGFLGDLQGRAKKPGLFVRPPARLLSGDGKENMNKPEL